MIVQIIWIVCIAFVFYLVLPLFASSIQKKRWLKTKTYLETISKSKENIFSIKEVKNKTLILFSKSKEKLSLNTNNCNFMILYKDEKTNTDYLNFIQWKQIQKIKRGQNCVFLESPSIFEDKSKSLCILTNETSIESFLNKVTSSNIDNDFEQFFKAYIISTGIFLEFLFFIKNLTANSLNFTTSLALLAIFGKALPYLPPGIILSLAANKLNTKSKAPEKDKTEQLAIKKQKREKIASWILFSLGIITNSGLFFLTLHLIGIALF